MLLCSLCREPGAFLTQEKLVTCPACARRLSHTRPVVPDDILEAWLFPRRSSRKPARLAEPSSSHGVWFPSPCLSAGQVSNVWCTGQQTTSPAEANNHHRHHPASRQQPAPDDKLLTIKSSHSCRGMWESEVSPPASGLRGALRE